jgi:hypothetical protein
MTYAYSIMSAHWPLDGPYSAERTERAATGDRPVDQLSQPRDREAPNALP